MTALDIEALAPAPCSAGDPLAETARILRASGTSFGPAMRLMPRARRDAMRALYAFCRVIDDIADEPGAPETKLRLLDEWDEEIARLYAGAPVSAIGRALADPVARHDLPEEELHLLVEGMRMDVRGPFRADKLDDLARYARHVAGSVGLLSMRIFGAWRGEPSERFALALAEALQFTNILRDVEEDAAMGRLYLPRDLLARHGVPADPATAPRHPALPAVCAEVGVVAAERYAAARGLIRLHELRPLAPALMMMGAYEAYLRRMEAQGFRRAPAVRLTRREKLLAGLGCALRAWRADARG